MISRNFKIGHYGGNGEFPAALYGAVRGSPWGSSMYGDHATM